MLNHISTELFGGRVDANENRISSPSAVPYPLLVLHGKHFHLIIMGNLGEIQNSPSSTSVALHENIVISLPPRGDIFVGWTYKGTPPHGGKTFKKATVDSFK